jgi:hypothetical protein
MRGKKKGVVKIGVRSITYTNKEKENTRCTHPNITILFFYLYLLGLIKMRSLPMQLSRCGRIKRTLSDKLVPVRHRARGQHVRVHDIDLLERETFGFGDTEVGEDQAAEAGRAPEEEDLDAQVGVSGTGVDEIRGGVGNAKVPEPVGGDGERHRFRAHVEREDFTGDDPCDGTPGRGEESLHRREMMMMSISNSLWRIQGVTYDVDADEGDESVLTGCVTRRDGDTDDGDDELANGHTSRTPEQETPTTEALNAVHTRERHEAVDKVSSDLDKECVLDAGLLEEGGTEVEDEVDTRELLPALDPDTGPSTQAETVVRVAEAVPVGSLTQTALFLKVSTDLVQLELNFGVRLGETSETSDRAGSVSVTSTLDQITRRLGQEEHADGENKGPDELDGNGDAVSRVIITVLGCVQDDSSQEETDGNGPLVGTDDGTTDPLGSALGLVHGDEHGDETDTKTGKDTTDDKKGHLSCSSLHGNTDTEDESGEDDTPLATEYVCNRSACEGTKESTCGQDGDNKRLLGGRDGIASRIIGRDGDGMAKGAEPVFHGLDTRDGTGIITEEDTTKGGETGLEKGSVD